MTDYAMQCENYYQNQSDLDEKYHDAVDEQVKFIEEEIKSDETDIMDFIEGVQNAPSIAMIYLKVAREFNNYDLLGRYFARVLDKGIKEEAESRAEALVYG